MTPATARVCRACGAHFVPAEQAVTRPASLRFCATCRADTCPTCHGRGRHHAGCPVVAGRARQPLPYRGVVDAEEFVAVFLATYANAVRAAEAIVGVAEGEDAAMDAALYLWRRRDTLEAIRPRLFLIAARQRAHHHRLSAWRRHVVPVEDLVDVEAMTAAFAVGGPRPAPVRLPEPVA